MENDADASRDTDFRAARPVGRNPYLICRFVSGQDCNRRMRAEAEHCGDPAHVRVVHVDSLRHDPDVVSQSSTLRRPTTVVNEDFDIITAEYLPWREFEPTAFQPERVWVSGAVQRVFTGYHGVSAHEAIAEIRLVLAQSVASGRGPIPWGERWRFAWKGYAVQLAPSLEVAVHYTTRHHARTPSETLAGAPRTRFIRAERTAARDLDPELWIRMTAEVAVGRRLSAPVTSVANFGVFVSLGEADGLVHRTNLELAGGEMPSDRFKVGDLLNVVVIDIDHERRRISLVLAT